MTRRELELRRQFAAQELKGFEAVLRRLDAGGCNADNSDHYHTIVVRLETRRERILQLDEQIKQLIV
jgi:hypothetical protein